jgi:hypothetical protein
MAALMNLDFGYFELPVVLLVVLEQSRTLNNYFHLVDGLEVVDDEL